MTAIQKKRLLRLADFIVARVPREKFDMARFGSWGTVSLDPKRCNTAACALGWCTVLFQRLGVKFSIFSLVYKDRFGYGVGVSLFGLTYEQSEQLFSGNNAGKSAAQVRREILQMVARLDKEKSDA